LLSIKTGLNSKRTARAFLAFKAMAHRNSYWFPSTNQIQLTATTRGMMFIHGLTFTKLKH